MLKGDFPIYTMHNEGNVFVKHVSKSKCIVVATWALSPHINVINYIEVVETSYFDEYSKKEAQPIPKARFDIERQQVINQLIHC